MPLPAASLYSSVCSYQARVEVLLPTPILPCGTSTFVRPIPCMHPVNTTEYSQQIWIACEQSRWYDAPRNAVSEPLLQATPFVLVQTPLAALANDPSAGFIDLIEHQLQVCTVSYCRVRNASVMCSALHAQRLTACAMSLYHHTCCVYF